MLVSEIKKGMFISQWDEVWRVTKVLREGDTWHVHGKVYLSKRIIKDSLRYPRHSIVHEVSFEDLVNNDIINGHPIKYNTQRIFIKQALKWLANRA